MASVGLAIASFPRIAAAGDDPDNDTRWSIEGETEVSSGTLSGHGTLREDAVFAEVGVQAKPQREIHDHWRLTLPTEARYRHTWLAPLRELQGELGPNLSFKPVKQWEFEVEGGADGRYRPGWPDQYQVRPDGSLAPTDRFSSWAVHGGGSVRWGSFKKTRIKIAYELTRVDYLDDPAYDPNEEPTHLVPSDRWEHSVKLDGHRRWGNVSVKPGLDIEYKHYLNAYARDAGTGLTHAGAGGAPPNPVLRVWDVKPGVRVEVVAIEDRLTITPGYVHEVSVDIYDGYYSYQGPHASLDVECELGKRWTADLDADLELRRYGSGSYAEGGAHPPLESGSRRREREFDVDLDVAYALTDHWSLFARAGWLTKASNLPDYVPGAYPAGRQYSIDWDYTNADASVGVRYGF